MAASKIQDKTQTATSVLALITDRLAGLTSEQFIAPSQKRRRDDKNYGQLNDHERRLYTLVAQVASEHDTLVDELARAGADLQTAVSKGRTPLEMLKGVLRGGASVEMVENVERLQLEHSAAHRLHTLVYRLFWTELKTRFTEVDDDARMVIYDDWSVGLREQSRHSHGPFGRMSGSIIVGGGADLPPMVRDMLKDMGLEVA